MYRELLTGALVAMDIDSRQQFRRPGESLEEFPMAADCTGDGGLAAYATVDFAYNVSRLSVAGRGAPDRPFKVTGIIQGISLSPDGRRIALSSNESETSGNHLWLLEVSGGELSPLPGGPGSVGQPRWSPDGQRLVFSSSPPGGRSQLYALEIGQAEPVQLFQRLAGALSFDWSPDGQTLVFSGPDANNQSQLFQADADGSGERQLTTSDTDKSAPVWSADGSTIAFAGTVPQVSRYASLLHNAGVWLVNADGTGERSLTDLALDAWPLAWCPPGPWLHGWKEQ